MLPSEFGGDRDSKSKWGWQNGDPLQAVLAVNDSSRGFKDLKITFDASGLCGGSEVSVLSEASEWLSSTFFLRSSDGVMAMTILTFLLTLAWG
jgi:hypothetical protein